MKVRREMLKQFEALDGKRRKVSIVAPVLHPKTNQIINFFIAE